MQVLITFQHQARPYTGSDEYANIRFESAAECIPNIGDVVSIKGITHPQGAFVVVQKIFHTDRAIGFEAVELLLGLESDEKA